MVPPTIGDGLGAPEAAGHVKRNLLGCAQMSRDARLKEVGD